MFWKVVTFIAAMINAGFAIAVVGSCFDLWGAPSPNALILFGAFAVASANQFEAVLRNDC